MTLRNSAQHCLWFTIYSQRLLSLGCSHACVPVRWIAHCLLHKVSPGNRLILHHSFNGFCSSNNSYSSICSHQHPDLQQATCKCHRDVSTGPIDVTPQKKPKDQLWTFQYHEPLRLNRRCDPRIWDGLFHYSISYVRSSDSNQYGLTYSNWAVKRNLKLKRNYYQEKLKTKNRKKANAL